MKHVSHKVVDDETGIVAHLSPTEITIENSKRSNRGYGSNSNEKNSFTFINSKPETVEKVAKALLRVVEEQKKLNPADFG